MNRHPEVVVETIDQADPECGPPAEVFHLYTDDLGILDPKGSLKTDGFYLNIRTKPERDRILNLLRQINSGRAISFKTWLRDHPYETLALVYWMSWETADDMERESERDYGRLAPITGYW